MRRLSHFSVPEDRISICLRVFYIITSFRVNVEDCGVSMPTTPIGFCNNRSRATVAHALTITSVLMFPEESHGCIRASYTNFYFRIRSTASILTETLLVRRSDRVATLAVLQHFHTSGFGSASQDLSRSYSCMRLKLLFHNLALINPQSKLVCRLSQAGVTPGCRVVALAIQPILSCI